MASKSIAKRPNGKWRARYRDQAGKEHARHFKLKVDAQRWLDEATADLVTGRHVDPKNQKMTVDQWCDEWLETYAHRDSTERQARVHLARVRREFGSLPLMAVDEMAVKRWTAKLKREGLSQSYRFALHNRLSQLLSSAVRAKKLASNPCSEWTTPGAGKPRPYVATEAQVWELYALARKECKAAILLGAFAGLRTAEACGLRVEDVRFLPREIHPTVQYPSEPLKTDMSRTTIPIPDSLVTALAQQTEGRDKGTVLVDRHGCQMGPWKVEREIRRIRGSVPDLPEGFRFHDLRHFFASLLIASGADIKIVQHRLRHASAKTTLDTYGHLWPGSDESTRAAVEGVMSGRILDSADSLRTAPGDQ